MGVRLEQFRQAHRIHGGLTGMLTAAAGVHLSRLPIPSKALRKRVFSLMYGGKYGALDESELEQPLTEYRSINALFTRGVRDELRPLSERTDVLLSPVDGTVQDEGVIQHDTVLTVKQISYVLSSLCPETDTASFNNGRFAILFLSPRDCHRVYSPADCQLTRVVHVPGSRLLVHPPYQTAQYPVFSLNERLVMELQTEHGRVLVILVAGWGVGCLTHPFPLPIPIRRNSTSVCNLTPAKTLQRGEWMATFELGSTVIILAERDRTQRTLCPRDTCTRIRQPLFELTTAVESTGLLT
jgi:phosphatidylserine decarboxylase